MTAATRKCLIQYSTCDHRICSNKQPGRLSNIFFTIKGAFIEEGVFVRAGRSFQTFCLKICYKLIIDFQTHFSGTSIPYGTKRLKIYF